MQNESPMTQADQQPESEPMEPATIGEHLSLGPHRGKLFAALAQAQAELADPHKANTANVQTRAGGAFAYNYLDLAGALRASRPILAKHGLSITQWPALANGVLSLTTVIAHKSGAWMAGVLSVAVPPAERMNPLQALGSVISYLRRYAYLAAVGLAADDDDGSLGQAATGPRHNAVAAPAKQAPAKSEPAKKAAARTTITNAQHRRVEAMIGEAGLDRERVRAWLASRFGDEYGDGIHLDTLRPEHAKELEDRIPLWARQARLEHEALELARKSFGWDGETATLGPIVAEMKKRAGFAAQAAQMKDGALDQDEVERARHEGERARALGEYLQRQAKVG